MTYEKTSKTIADIARWIMKNRSDAEDVYMLLREALSDG